MNDLISIIIACRNGVNYVKEAIDSIKAQNMNTEIIVVDDGSTDNTAEYAKSCGATVYSIEHSGPSAARNVALQHMHGDYVMFLDHDDVLTDGALRTLYDALVQNPDIDYTQGKLQDFISPDLTDEEKKQLAPRPGTYGGLLTGAYLISKRVLEFVPNFNENLKTGETVDFLLRVEGAPLKTQKLDFVTTRRRLHNNNTGRTMPQQERKDYASILRAKLAAKK